MRTLCIMIGALLAALASPAQRMTRQQYVDRYGAWAVQEMQRTGIPASITLAQGILESDCGNSMLAIDGNNHFGIKCPGGWQGATLYKDDDRRHECFRSYESAYESFRDHSDFLTGRTRYAELFALSTTDYKGWARGLKKAGYATAPDYADRLIQIIEEEGLDAYDRGEGQRRDSAKGPDTSHWGLDGGRVIAPNPNTKRDKHNKASDDFELPQPTKRKVKAQGDFGIDPLPVHAVQYNNGVRYIELGGSDTLESIAAEFHLMGWELLRYNDMTVGDDLSGLRFLYIGPKRNRAHPSCAQHEVREGDSMWRVAHKYGIKLKRLAKMNPTLSDATLSVGDQIRLR